MFWGFKGLGVFRGLGFRCLGVFGFWVLSGFGVSALSSRICAVVALYPSDINPQP